MTNKSITYFDIIEAKKAFSEGENITELLRLQKGNTSNTSEIIETAYDVQAGSYIDFAESNYDHVSSYASELAEILRRYLKDNDSLIDVGTGEITTLSQVLSKLKKLPRIVYAFDISFSRIYKGTFYAKNILGLNYKILNSFVADISEIPFPDKSINITTSNHALEPNGEKLKELLLELFRITVDKLILFEPCFEINSSEGKKRMKRLGYIKNIDGVVKELGGDIIEKIIMKNIDNPLNPTVCYVINPPRLHETSNCIIEARKIFYSVPGANFQLKRQGNFYFSNQAGLFYPILKGIPILKTNNAILASALTDLTS
jgi:ubiquinone/menaquinone biosynthesis C-methylase UbiE